MPAWSSRSTQKAVHAGTFAAEKGVKSVKRKPKGREALRDVQQKKKNICSDVEGGPAGVVLKLGSRSHGHQHEKKMRRATLRGPQNAKRTGETEKKNANLVASTSCPTGERHKTGEDIGRYVEGMRNREKAKEMYTINLKEDREGKDYHRPGQVPFLGEISLKTHGGIRDRRPNGRC